MDIIDNPPPDTTFNCVSIEDGLWFGLQSETPSTDYVLYLWVWSDESNQLTGDLGVAFTSKSKTIQSACSTIKSYCMQKCDIENGYLCFGCSLRDLLKAMWTERVKSLKIYCSSRQKAFWTKCGLRDILDSLAVLMPSECLPLLRPHAKKLMDHLGKIPELVSHLDDIRLRLEEDPFPPILRRKMWKDLAKRYLDEMRRCGKKMPAAGPRPALTPVAYVPPGSGQLARSTSTSIASEWIKTNLVKLDGSIAFVQDLHDMYERNVAPENVMTLSNFSKLVRQEIPAVLTGNKKRDGIQLRTFKNIKVRKVPSPSNRFGSNIFEPPPAHVAGGPSITIDDEPMIEEVDQKKSEGDKLAEALAKVKQLEDRVKHLEKVNRNQFNVIKHMYKRNASILLKLQQKPSYGAQ
ncbi:uncharacterized protein LOC110853686 isoform X2 [Folsomia candida]|uniref:uncharacterized protein LOC110853686 isoform X2 n=1 Tax=Folsomia candida TaxID=158441 RepID=UPI000B90517E|nr:uncharacterized protein LOC110853686 isoform X2 [Folsomia candida]